MGQSVSGVIQAVDNQDEKKKAAQDALNAMATIAKDKQVIHYQSVISDAMDAKRLPIRHVITNFTRMHCGVSKDAAGLKANVGEALKNFAKGEMVEGLAAIASEALDILIGNVSANSSELSSYTITVGELGGIGRIDFYMYYYKYTSSALTTIAEDCLVTSLVISSVDVKDLDDNDVRVVLQRNYSGKLANETAEQSSERLDKMVKLITDAVSKSKGGEVGKQAIVAERSSKS